MFSQLPWCTPLLLSAANCLYKPAAFPKKWRSLNGAESAEGHLPREIFSAFSGWQ
jgi:hypothetical protein